MAFFEKDELKSLYEQAKTEALQHREDYDEFERLADNGLLKDLDPTLPETNDGSLAAALHKLPKRVVNSDLTGRVKALDADDAWIAELANIYWEDKIIPNANSQAPFHRKWKDAVRKAAIYGGQPLITLFVENGDYTGADFVVPYAQDVKLEPGKVSDADSDIIFWDVYYTKKQVKDLLEQAREENKDKSGYNKWSIKALEDIISGKYEEERDGQEVHDSVSNKAVTKGGIHFCIVFQRGIEAPFYMYHKASDKTVREWKNPDPTGDIPVHYLYCYQDLINPYGVGIVKLAGGTQNVLDYMRQADVLATQLGIRPPKIIAGNEDDVDEDSLVYAQDANWWIGNAQVERIEMANGVYSQLPTRMGMYKTSLNQLIPTGDTSVSAESGDPNYSKTPAGVKFQAASLSIDDEDFKDNLYMTFESVAKSMINTQFANMQGSDIIKLSDEEREVLAKAGLEFPVDETGTPTNDLEIIWDEARATFDFEVDAEEDKATDEEKRLEGLLKVLELRTADPSIPQALMMSGYQLNDGELFKSIIELTTDNDKIITEIDPEEMSQMQGGLPGEVPQDVPVSQNPANIEALMAEQGVDEETALSLLEAEEAGMPPEQILAGLEQARQENQG